jgi:Na+/H+ antiporter NhaD/arsenite permease-like protein
VDPATCKKAGWGNFRAVETILAGLILVATLTLVLVRPKDMSEAWWALLGGGLTLVLGLVTLRQAGSILLET